MALSDSLRYRQRLLDAITDKGLEELTLRLWKPEYPDAHRIRGKDGGIDVLSDYETPPTRAWQAKNYKEVPWGECRESLAAAMAGDRPRRYSFVFPFVITKNQRDFWRDEFYPEQMRLYPSLKIDYVDDLAQRLGCRPDLVDLLADGALADYFRTTMAQTARDGINPLASAGDLTEDPLGMAEHARHIGANDPNFAYGLTGREPNGAEGEIAERSQRFTMNHGVEQLPDFSLEIRVEDRIAGIRADRRAEAPRSEPSLWFAPDEQGEVEFLSARKSLAKGRPIEFGGHAVGLRPGLVPDRFRYRVGEDGLFRGGTIRVGLSEPLELTIELELGDRVAVEEIPVYRIPAREPHHFAYGGSFKGAVITLDFKRLADADTTPDREDLEMNFGLTLGVDGERACDAVSALGFARAFGQADQITVRCPRLLPPEGLSFDYGEGDARNQDVWEVAAAIAAALAALESRDGTKRLLPQEAKPADLYAARLVCQVLDAGGVESPVAEESVLPLYGENVDGKKPADLLDSEFELPPIADQATAVFAYRRLIDLAPLEILDAQDGPPRLRVRPLSGDARVVIALSEH
jgi:hypothetical protein